MQPGGQHDFDLGSEFHFQLIEAGLVKLRGEALHAEKATGLIDQRRHLFPAGYRPPGVIIRIPDGGEVNAEGNIRVISEEVHGVVSPRAGDHQAGGTHHAFVQRANDGFIHRIAHAKIIRIEDQ